MPFSPEEMQSLRREHPARLPVSVSILPATWMKYRERLDELLLKHRELFPAHEAGKRDYDRLDAATYHVGEHIDAWGCVWENLHDGFEAIVTGHPYPRREDLAQLTAPKIDAGLPHGFMFLRLLDLRGYEEALIDFAEEPPELQKMIDLVRDYNIRQVKLRLPQLGAAPDTIWFGDDLGTQHGLPLSPHCWRRYLKPAFTAIYAPVKAAGHYVYMHTDGGIWEIMPDLADCGVDVVNPQFRANGMERLREVMRSGRLTIDLDLDRQLFPFATPAQIDAHVRDCVQELADPAGGLWLKVEIAPDISLENITAIFTALEKYRELH
jgi:hypothetical protein